MWWFSRAHHCSALGFWLPVNYLSGVFPRGPWLHVLVRGGEDLKPALFSSSRALPFPFPLGGSHGAWWNSGLSLNSHRCNSRPWAKSVFPLFLKFRWFRWFCGPLANATRPLTPHCPFSLSLPPPLLSIKDIYPVGFPPAWHEVLLTAASINGWYYRAQRRTCTLLGYVFILLRWYEFFGSFVRRYPALNADCFLQRSFRGESFSMPRDMLLFLRSNTLFSEQIIVDFAFYTFLAPVV